LSPETRTGRASLWEGIVVSEEANRANIFHKLSLATRAKDLIERAYRIDPRAGHGAAMSLGVLTTRPGLTDRLRDKQRARRLLLEGLAIDPAGLDANYFWGDFLYSQEMPREHVRLSEGSAGAARSQRPAWDAGRRREVQGLLAKIG
jgi:tetratricopeptide (TPR) repeat protein